MHVNGDAQTKTGAGRKTTAGQVISELARTALTGDQARPVERSPKSRFGFRPFPKRGSIVTNDLIDSLREGDADG